jgi:hypothetical protein
MSDSVAEHVELAARQVGVIREAVDFGPGRPNRGRGSGDFERVEVAVTSCPMVRDTTVLP